ncbi:unnamed protein product [Linum trigynum]|uniref:Late embryogenesis abundant protein LEA-2 subgroup domain-containing protein n=1 Tax=Linum trigynum TaxID=586398 RepID=A0AAV2CPY1_9ROSI
MVTFSSSSDPLSPLLPQANSPSAAVVDAITTTDPPPPPLPAVKHDGPKPIEFAIFALVFLLFFGGMWTVMSINASKPYSPSADVVSAFVSIKNNISNIGPAGVGRLLTANWAVTLHLDDSIFCCREAHLYQVEASVFHSAENRQYLLASTRRFYGSTADPKTDDGAALSIYLRAEQADVGEHVVAAISREVAAGGGNRLRFKLVALAWISCDPFWVVSPSITARKYWDTKKCQVQVTSQRKPAFLDTSSTRFNLTNTN